MIYIVNCDELKFFKTFDSLNSVIDYFKEKNKSDFDGEPFSLFGRGQKEVWNGDESEWINDSYYIDSIVLSPKENPNKYFTFFIRCISTKGDLIELD